MNTNHLMKKVRLRTFKYLQHTRVNKIMILFRLVISVQNISNILPEYTRIHLQINILVKYQTKACIEKRMML